MFKQINCLHLSNKTIKKQIMISKSIEERAFKLIQNGVEVLEAIKQAIIEENKFISEMLDQKTDRSKKAKNTICKNVYGLIHLTN